MNNIAWQNIRPLNGSKSDGFQELCVQLARVESPDSSEFTALGVPDAGVECYCVLADGDEWGWQAKYFPSSLTKVQWQQLDSSVKTALDKHPKLVRYYVCVPRDRSDARVSKQTSEMDKWNGHVIKWEMWAQDRGMTVEFIWWGSSELVYRLSREEHTGRSFFWFGQHEFSQNWFDLHLAESVEAAGPRYTPELHVDLPVAQELERFSNISFLADEVKSLAIRIRRAHDGFVSAGRQLEQPVETSHLDDLSKATRIVLDAFARLEPSPVSLNPFGEIASAVEEACNAGHEALGEVRKLQREYDGTAQEHPRPHNYSVTPLQSLHYYIQPLLSELQEAVDACNHADSIAKGQLLILKGKGGTGKSHLLCDFAKNRVQRKLPTLLLMGQRFLSDDDPWTQMLRLLDLKSASAEEVVGALESSAQAANCRALVIIDALNEGNGRRIWPEHLAAFLERLEKSPWIGVILSIRSSYEKALIPEYIKERAFQVTHSGFSGHEYDAVRTFFTHYHLEFPSTPILQPEFSNPLFLKTICNGLRDSGFTRIPRGFHGITEVFDLYLEAINTRLAKPESLDYDSRDDFVRQALERISERLAHCENRWLPRSEAQAIVNSLLPGKGHSKSLYMGLVVEGVLTEDMNGAGGLSEELVFITYDRFADHVIANYLLDLHLDTFEPEVAFSEKGGLGFLCEQGKYVPPGLIEAFSIQAPERTGKELVRLAPSLLNHPYIGDSFLESIVWRNLGAFSQDTRTVLNELHKENKFSSHPLDVLLSVLTVPNHPFNAIFIDERLRQDSMPERDAWWSTYLHSVWRTDSWMPKGAIHRLMDWAFSVSATDNIEDEVVDLAAAGLGWTLTTPNRFLRDSATKALVVLLTGRLEAACRMVSRFHDVDDPYVGERLYAVAYGVAMRSHDPIGVGELASLVYDRVFAFKSPPVHILLRDYARGVVERAIHLGSNISINQDLIRPPYGSKWPDIPDADVIDALFPNGNSGAWVSGDLEWSRKWILHSVEGKFLGDFARYVIGTDTESNWLEVRLDEAIWQSPTQRLQGLLSNFSEAERSAWKDFEEAKAEVPPLAFWPSIKIVDESGNTVESLQRSHKRVDEQAIELALKNLELAQTRLISVLSKEHQAEWSAICEDDKDYKTRQGPRLDKRLIQRYILWRVFDLGWTIERFGRFDRFDIGDSGRAAAKAERMGKKYQWIAYHEILAYIADQYQYRERYDDDDVKHQYVGPWQESLRNIDPSCTSKSTPGGTSWGPHKSTWWVGEDYYEWNEDSSLEDWVADRKALPSIAALIESINPGDGTRWLNLDGFFVWRQPHPADIEPYESELRELWIMITVYLVRREDAESFMSWARTVNFMGRWMPDPPQSSSIYLGEYSWAPVFEYERSLYSDFDVWVKPGSQWANECPVSIRPASFRYFSESGGFDCSVEQSFKLNLPCRDVVDHLGLRMTYNGVDYADENGNLVIQDPTAHETGPTALLMNKAFAENYLLENSLTICWTVLGEKQVIGGHPRDKSYDRLEMSGAYTLTRGEPTGFINLRSS